MLRASSMATALFPEAVGPTITTADLFSGKSGPAESFIKLLAGLYQPDRASMGTGVGVLAQGEFPEERFQLPGGEAVVGLDGGAAGRAHDLLLGSPERVPFEFQGRDGLVQGGPQAVLREGGRGLADAEGGRAEFFQAEAEFRECLQGPPEGRRPG